LRSTQNLLFARVHSLKGNHIQKPPKGRQRWSRRRPARPVQLGRVRRGDAGEPGDVGGGWRAADRRVCSA
jgi:hypothetical protein